MSGFAEFIRNLLICKDEKASRLLDVVEDFKEKYRQVSQDVEGSYLISALNLLSESELHYKAARNKRLHVELALIKLSYLNQALHLSSGPADKKKGTESVKPVAYRLLRHWKLKEKKSVPPSPEPAYKDPVPVASAKPSPKLVIEESITPPPVTSFGALSKIRQEVVNRKPAATSSELKPLEDVPVDGSMETVYFRFEKK